MLDADRYMSVLLRSELTSLTLVLEDSHCARAAVTCPKLRSLDLTGSKELSDAGLHHFLEHCPEITEIALTRSRITDDVSFKPLLPGQVYSENRKRFKIHLFNHFNVFANIK